MDTLLMFLALIPSILSCSVSVFYAFLHYKKSKEPPKDDVWETATKIICSNGGNVYSDDFAELYTELKFFKEHPDLVQQHHTIRNAMQKASESE